MRSEVMKHHGLTRDLPRAGYFETEQQREVFDDITAAIHSGKLLTLVGLVGCGKTTTPHRLIATLKGENEIPVAQSLAVDKHRVSLGTLMTALFWLDGIKGQERAYLEWLLAQCSKSDSTEILTEEAIERLASALSTPLQIEQYLGLALEAAYQIGQKPVTVDVVDSVLSADLDALEATLTRYGYNTRALAELLNVRPAVIRAFLHGQLTPGRTQELHAQLLAAGLPV